MPMCRWSFRPVEASGVGISASSFAGAIIGGGGKPDTRGSPGLLALISTPPRYHTNMNSENLWAPWRMAYLRELERKVASAKGMGAVFPGAEADEVCFLSEYWENPEKDRENHVIHRDEQGMILLNRYPYANGHLLVALGEPRPSLLDYEPQQRAAFWRLVELAMELMCRAIAPQGINMGINVGRAAGAGIPEHVHAHLVPRWSGDTNFITTVGMVRVIPDSLETMAEQYREAAAGLEA
ncbi:MAG: HIT domain-containing protein [Phycisphaerales bacterium]|nr:MAG: HIT domain-containing protein [Phycisphaerales bacterium]